MKLSKAIKKYTTGSRFGFKKASPLNPWTHGIFSTKKIINGFRNKTWKANVGKVLAGGSRSPTSAANIWSTGSYGSPYGVTGSIVGRY